ncbi:MAG: hypothetical protein J6T03_01405 [Bacteroidales bacterium]|nr:hypothetical protein [Bacteroidales bacterium]
MEQLIFQLSDDPNLELLEAWELERHFHANNPFWVAEGEPLELENYTREEAINILKTELGKGYSVNGDMITATKPDQYIPTIVKHLQTVASSGLTSDYPLGWWKKEVCQYRGILILINEEMMTLNEFMLYAVSLHNDGVTTFHIGSIFEYC